MIGKHTSCQTSEQPGTSWLSIYYMFSAPRNNSVLAIHYRNNKEHHCQYAPRKHEQQHLTFISQMVAGKGRNHNHKCTTPLSNYMYSLLSNRNYSPNQSSDFQSKEIQAKTCISIK